MKITTNRFHFQNGWENSVDSKLDSENTAISLFGAAHLSEEGRKAIDEIRKLHPKSTLIGCSSSGEIYERNVDDETLSLSLVQFEKTKIQTLAVDIEKFSGSKQVGEEIARNLNAPDLKAIFLLSDGLHVNGSELVRGINQGIGDGVIVTGGLGGDGDRFEKT